MDKSVCTPTRCRPAWFTGLMAFVIIAGMFGAGFLLGKGLAMLARS